MGVALQAALGVTVSLLIAGEVPDDQGLVARTRQQHVGAKCRRQVSTVFEAKIRGSRSQVSYFSREVAREVTQPLWPSRVPRRTSCSAMMGMRRWKGKDGRSRSLTLRR